MPGWSLEDMPPRGTSGIGCEAAFALAGARIVIASSNQTERADVLAEIRAAHPGAEIAFE